MDLSDDPVRLDYRLSGQIKRYHTWPIIGQQTVADHCWQIMRIYLSITEKIDHHMIRHIIFHDIGESTSGDVPYPLKSENPRLKEEMDLVEHKSYCRQLDYWGAFQPVCLTEQDRTLFKHMELIEMAEFGMEQICLGNHQAFIIADRCLRKVHAGDPILNLARYVAKRLYLFSEQYGEALVWEIAGSSKWWSPRGWLELEKTDDSK